MQGAGAEDSIVAALDAVADRMDDFDAVVLIRGGGSASDLNCFNAYRLCAHIAQFPLPEFIILTLIGTVPWTIFLVYVGSVLGHNWAIILDYKWEIAGVCLLISLVIALGYYVYHKRKSK